MRPGMVFNAEELWRFEKELEDATTAGHAAFAFQGHMVTVEYAKHLIERIRPLTKGKRMVGSGDAEGFEDIMAEHKIGRLEAVIWKFQKDYYGYSDDLFPVQELANYIRTHVQDVQV